MLHVHGSRGEREAANAAGWAPTLVRGEMKYWLLPPDVRLRRDVRSYFYVEAKARDASQDELHLPDGYAEIVFNLGEKFERAALGSDQAASAMASSYAIGARSHSVVTRDDGNVKVIGVKLEPHMLHSLARTSLADMRDSTISLRDLNDRRLLALEASLNDCTSVCDVRRTLDAFFLAQRQHVRSEPLVEHCLERIRATHGLLSLTEWTRALGVDARTLQRKFAAWVGMTPKTYARIVRFKHAYHRLVTQHAGRHSDDHLDGYYDQSHFYKEFRFFTGTSPQALLEARTPASTAVTDHLLEGDLSAA